MSRLHELAGSLGYLNIIMASAEVISINNERTEIDILLLDIA